MARAGGIEGGMDVHATLLIAGFVHASALQILTVRPGWPEVSAGGKATDLDFAGEAGGGEPPGSISSHRKKPRRRWRCSARRNSRPCGREIDNQQLAARRHQARRLGHGRGGFTQIVQDLMNDDQIGGGRPERPVLKDIAVTQLASAEASGGDVAPWRY